MRGVRHFGSPRVWALLRQVGKAVLTLLVISVVTFAAMNVRTAEDIARQKLGRGVTSAQIDAFAQQYGLDQPVYERYGIWLGHFVRGDMGSSYVTEQPVTSDIVPRFKKTLILSLVSVLLAVPIAMLIGLFQATRFGRPSDMTLMTSSIVLAALPEFVIAIGLLMLFSVQLGWLPVESGSALTFASSFSDQAKAYVMPALVLIIAMVAYIARIARASIREALAAPYTQAAVLRGLPRQMVLWDHVVRNAAVPIVNAVAISIVYLLGGVIVIENVFAFPGIGQGLVQAISNTDTIAVQGIVLLMGAMFIAISLVADLVVVYLNPRLKATQ